MLLAKLALTKSPSYWRSFATPVTVIRPFNTYGPRQDADGDPDYLPVRGRSSNQAWGFITNVTSIVADTCAAFVALVAAMRLWGK